MNLLKQISEDITTYRAFVHSLVEKIEEYEREISNENRLGLLEAPYFIQDKNPNNQGNNDTINFQAPTEPVAAPVQHPNASNALQRIHLIYDPAKGKVVNAIKTDPRARPPAEYIEASAQQVADAMKHIESFSPETAQKLKSGQVNIWIPRAQAQSSADRLQSTGTGPDKVKMQMSPDRLAAAQKAASQMSLS